MKNLSSKVLGVIPARYDSVRFPGKLLKQILGKTLIQRTYENAILAKGLDEIIVATDDIRIFQHVKDFGGHVVMTSKDCATGTDRVAEVLRSGFFEYSIVTIIQGDEPCLNPEVIDVLIEELKNASSDDEIVMTTPVVKLKQIDDILNPSVVKCVFDKTRKALYFSRAPVPYPKALTQFNTMVNDPQKICHFLSKHEFYRHLGIYCSTRDFLLEYTQMPPTRLQMAEDLEQLKILENNYSIRVAIVEDEGIGVDLPQDIQKVEDILCSQNTYSSQVV